MCSDAGPTAALALALAAGTVEEAARHASAAWEEAGGAVAQATALRRRGLRLAHEDLEAHLDARAALDAASKGEPEQGGNSGRLGAALTRAAEVPLEIAEAGVDVVALAALTAAEGSPDVRADAAGAALLAAGAVSVAAHLIEVNLSTGPDDQRLARAHELTALAEAASEQARAVSD